MPTVEIITLLFGGIGIGGVTAFLLTKVIPLSSNKTNKLRDAGQIPPIPEMKTVLEKFEVERARREYKALRLEKELHADMLTRVYQAEADKRITKRERELLSTKYREQIRNLDEKLNDSELIMEANELANLREEMLNLFRTKIAQMERRLGELMSKLDQVKGPLRVPVPPLAPPKERVRTPAVEVSTAEEEHKEITSAPVIMEKSEQVAVQPPEQKISAPDAPVADERVKAIRNEVLEALARLEQMDVES
jgi:hypothetical protein